MSLATESFPVGNRTRHWKKLSLVAPDNNFLRIEQQRQTNKYIYMTAAAKEIFQLITHLACASNYLNSPTKLFNESEINRNASFRQLMLLS